MSFRAEYCVFSNHYEHYTWSSILLFDRKYRALQAATKSPWNTEIEHLGSTTLVRRNPKPGNVANRSELVPAPPSKQHDPSNEPCRLFNQGRCGYNPCRFKHVCFHCRGYHPAYQHGAPAGGAGHGFGETPPMNMPPPMATPPPMGQWPKNQ